MEEHMSDYTIAEVIDVIEAPEEDGGLDGDWYALERRYQSLTLRGEVVQVVPVENFGGEGKGDDTWVVFQLGTQLFRKSGYYASHYGTDWDGPLEEVRPVQKMVTFYEPA
jgi:hypothetical protein